MRKEPFKVNEQEFKLVQQIRNLKEKGLTDEDILQLDRNKEISKENMQKTRLDTIKITIRRIKQVKRDIEYKRMQIKENKSLEKDDRYVDGKKPFFILENDIEETEANIRQMEESIELIQGEYDRDEKNEQKT